MIWTEFSASKPCRQQATAGGRSAIEQEGTLTRFIWGKNLLVAKSKLSTWSLHAEAIVNYCATNITKTLLSPPSFPCQLVLPEQKMSARKLTDSGGHRALIHSYKLQNDSFSFCSFFAFYIFFSVNLQNSLAASSSTGGCNCYCLFIFFIIIPLHLKGVEEGLGPQKIFFFPCNFLSCFVFLFFSCLSLSVFFCIFLQVFCLQDFTLHGSGPLTNPVSTVCVSLCCSLLYKPVLLCELCI